MLTDPERESLRGLLRKVIDAGMYPLIDDFRKDCASTSVDADDLAELGHVCINQGRYCMTLKGLRACESPESRSMISACNRILVELHALLARGETPPKPAISPSPRVRRSTRGKQLFADDDFEPLDPPRWTIESIATSAGLARNVGAIAMTFVEYLVQSKWPFDSDTGLVDGFTLDLDVGRPLVREIPDTPTPDNAGSTDTPAPRAPHLSELEVDGYRLFSSFKASFGDLTVVIGANGSGKSTLLDFLQLAALASETPIPPEIDSNHPGRSVFRVGAPEQITVTAQIRAGRFPVRYSFTLLGPLGSPSVVEERLASCEPKFGWREPFSFIYTNDGKRFVRTRRERLDTRDWKMPPNELVLRRALDPTLATAQRVQDFLASWKFFYGFDVSSASPVRKPAFIEPQPTLMANGGNLSAVLFALVTESPEVWHEIETHLRSAVPGFQSLKVKTVGKGTVMGWWRERGLTGDLTLADLSDGTLRLLCWLALCHSPTLPPFICIDEPETGLHPRVLPLLAGLLRVASSRSQLLITTHSPYFLSQFSLEEIAVLRKDDSKSTWVRPASSDALRKEVEELGGDSIARFHVSDELEARS